MKVFFKLARTKYFLTSYSYKGRIADTSLFLSGLCKVHQFSAASFALSIEKNNDANEKCMQAHNIRGIFWLSLDST